MPRIHQLPDDLIARIAAGEVVERPASVIKELVENSLDAGARRIAVAIEGAGRSLISISDDGCGMTKADALLALRRHATSKISSFDDLETIATFGFRGEALPSIAAVSRLRLITRSAEEESGWEFLLDGGKLISEKPVAREPGTTIEVRDLFFNTPARFKFLKSDGTERAQCLRTLEELAFSALGVSFDVSLEKGATTVFRSRQTTGGQAKPKSDDLVPALSARLQEAWGGRWGSGLAAVQSTSPHFSLWGVVTDPEHHQASPRHQFLYVNRRPVQNRRLTRAVYEAYTGQLPSLRHPGWALFLEVNPASIDVNVHPSKKEVKLTHESEIFGFMMTSIKQALGEGVKSGHRTLVSDTAANAFSYSNVRCPDLTPSPRAAEVIHELYRPLETQELALPAAAELIALAQVNNLFIVAESGDGVVIVDQHAAAEKVIYERLMANAAAQEPAVQMLLVPFPWETSLSVHAWVTENLTTLKSFGFLLEPFGARTFLIKGHPAHLGEKIDLHSLLDGVSDLLNEPSGAPRGAQGGWSHRIAAMAACKAAVKAGDALDLKECQRVLNDLALCQAPQTCPHGRPTTFRLPLAELKHKFRR